MALQLNPTVNDPFTTDTLATLRQKVFDRLGFIQPQQANINQTGYRTLADLAAIVRTYIGLTAPTPIVTDTYGNIRSELFNMLNMSAMTANPPPGVGQLLTSYINMAQQMFYRAVEVDAGNIVNDLGPETVTNGTFAGNASSWGLGAEWAYNSNSIVNTNASTHTLASQQINVISGNTYLIQWQQTQSTAYNPTSNTGGLGIVCSLGPVTSQPILLQQATQTLVSVTLTASATGGLILSFQNTAGNIGLPGYTPSGTCAITSISMKQLGSGAYTGTQPPAMAIYQTTDNVQCKLDARVITTLAIALAKDHYDQDPKPYFELYQKFLKDLLERNPPNIQNMIYTALAQAQRMIASDIEVGFANGQVPALANFAQPTDTVTMDPLPITLLATARLKTLMKQPDAGDYMGDYKKWLSDLVKRQPPNAVSTVNRLLKEAQGFLFRAYKVFRMERWFTWTTVAGQRFYGTLNDDNAAITSPTNVTATLGGTATGAGMATARQFPGSVVMQNGKVLIVGGTTPTGDLNSADIFDPSTNTFTATGSMTYRRVRPYAAVLSSGKVIVMGGTNGGVPILPYEIYDPTTGLFTVSGAMLSNRANPAYTVMADGRILITGGGSVSNALGKSAEIYSPVTGLSTASAGVMTDGRAAHTSTLLQNGQVLVAGGNGIASADLYNPITDSFAATGPMALARINYNARLLPTGNVMILGGSNTGTVTAQTELYDPGAGTFSAGPPMTVPRQNFITTQLNSNKYFIAGNSTTATTSADIYDPATNTVTVSAGALPYNFTAASADLLSSGVVMVFGGSSATSTYYSSAFSYNPTADSSAINGGLTVGNLYYRVANFNSLGYTIPSLQDAVITGVPANSAVVVNWVNSNNPSVAGSAIYGRSVAASTSIPASFIIPVQGTANNVVTVLSAAGITVGSAPSISDGTNTLSIKVTAVIGNALTYTLTTIVSGVAGNIMATASTVLLSSEQLLANVGQGVTTWTDYGTIVPNGAMPTVNTTGAAFGLDPREITYVGASCNQATWRPLIKGVPPEIYSTNVSGPPQFYDIRQAIEIWPAPADSTWQIQIKGYFSPPAFNVDTDTCWIDPAAIYHWTVYLAKLAFGHKDAIEAKRDAMAYIGNLVAGTHQTARYIPTGGVVNLDAVRPLLLSPETFP